MPIEKQGALRQTQRFLYNRWAARRTAAVMMIVLYSFLLWVILGQEGRLNNWLETVVVGVAAVVALVFVIISRHPVTRLTIGPDGIFTPYGTSRSIAWHEIETARYVARRPLFLPLREWLHISVKPGVPSLSRIPIPHALESWLIGHAGIRIPLHVLRAPSGEVLSSIERFMPVVEGDLVIDEIIETAKDYS